MSDLYRVLDRGYLPRAVAVYGASDRRLGSQAARISRVMLERGYQDRVVLVNPRQQVVHGITTVPSATDATQWAGRLDFALISVPSASVERAVDDCLAAGIRLAMITSSRFAELGTEGAQLQRRVLANARAGGLRLLGPNCMGLLNVQGGFFSSQPKFLDVIAGNVSVIGQSGSLAVKMLEGISRAGLGIDTWTTIGNCADLGPAELISWLARRDTTEVVVCYLESLGPIAPLRTALLEARQAGKHVVLLRGGTTPRGHSTAASHTAAVASVEVLVDVLLDETGVVSAGDVAEAITATAVLAGLPRFRKSLAVVGTSGGECVLAADACVASGVPLATFSEATTGELRRLVPEINATNPVDITPFGVEAGLESDVLRTVAEDEEVGCVVLIGDTSWAAAPGEPDADAWRVRNIDALAEVAKMTPVVLDAQADISVKRALVGAGVVVTDDSSSLWSALATAHEGEDAAAPEDSGTAAAGAAVSRLMPEEEAESLLAGAGVPILVPQVASDVEEALQIAGRLGYPVVLKGRAEGVGHKTEANLVRLGIADEATLRDQYSDLVANLERVSGGEVVIQRQVGAGLLELMVGTIDDPEFGVHVMVSRGGIWAETEVDRAWARAPLSIEGARELVRRLRVGRALFDGVRGVRGDLEAVAQAVASLSTLAHEQAGRIAEIDLNPLIVGEDFAVAVDCLIRTRDVATAQDGGRDA